MKIFISYRRSETSQEAQRIRLQLQLVFGIDSVFIDRAIPPGKEFDRRLESELKSCDVLVAVMGNDFLRTRRKKNAQGEEDFDYVRWEVETALQREIPIFPIIVKSHGMPPERDLPERLKAFAKKQALYAKDPAFETAIDQLVKELKASGVGQPMEGEIVGQEAAQSRPDIRKPPSQTFASSALNFLNLQSFLVMLALLTLLGWTIQQLGQHTETALAETPRYFLLGLVFATTTASITFCPLWFYKLVNVVRARHHLNVGSMKSIVVTCSAASIWVTNTVFLSLATHQDFEYTFLGLQLPIWAYILMGLLGTLWLALLATVEVALNFSTRRYRGLGLAVIFGSHALNCLIQFALLFLLLQSVAAGDSAVLNGLLLYLVACTCGTATFGVSWAWRGFFSSNGYWSLTFLSGTLVASWVFLTLAAYSHAFAKLVL